MKKFLLLFVILSYSLFGQSLKFGNVRGLLGELGIGGRVPIESFAEEHNMGIGIQVSLLYTDEVFVPIFFFSRFSYQHFPGNQDIYRSSDYSAVSSDVLIGSFGGRYYFSPLIAEDIILMPIIEGGISLAHFERVNEFKIDSREKNYVDDNFKFGFHAGIGISAFLMDVIASYNYYKDNSFISLDVKVQLPLYIKM